MLAETITASMIVEHVGRASADAWSRGLHHGSRWPINRMYECECRVCIYVHLEPEFVHVSYDNLKSSFATALYTSMMFVSASLHHRRSVSVYIYIYVQQWWHSGVNAALLTK